MIWRSRQSGDSPLHGQVTCLKHVKTIYFFNAGATNAYTQCASLNLFRHELTALFAHAFGVVQALNAVRGIQYHCAGDNGSGKRANTNFINTGNMR
jgi:hypothetical protein